MWEAVCEAVVLFAQHRTAAPLDNASMGHGSQRNSTEANRDAKNGEKLEIPIAPDMLDEDDEGDEDVDVDSDINVGADEGDDIATDDDEAAEGAAGEGDEDDDEAEAGEGAGEAEGDDEDAAEAAGEGQGEAEGSEPGDGADDGEGGADEAGESTDGETDAEGGEGAGGDAGDHDDDDDEPLTQDDIDAITDEAKDNWLNDSAVEEDLKAYEDALNGGASQLPVYIGGVSRDVAAAAKAENLASQIEQAFEMATMDRQPAWVEQQRRGIVNVNRYVTRQAGEVEYFRNWVEDDQPGYDIAVRPARLQRLDDQLHGQLAQAGYAAKLACQRLGIPCTVTLWDNEAKTLFDANETPSGLPTLNVSRWH